MLRMPGGPFGTGRRNALVRPGVSTRQVLAVVSLTLLVSVFGSEARADMGVVLHQSLSRGFSWLTGTGHSSVFLSRVCPASPVELRLCAPDEAGSVISTYRDYGFGEDHDFEWIAVPLNVFLYGVPQRAHRPLVTSPGIKRALEERYRGEGLAAYCDSPACASTPDAEWRAMVGATFTRTVDVFVVTTTLEQDLAFIAEFNRRPNRNRFSGIRYNCADFTRDLVNMFFPDMTRRNYLNDFGMTSPKGIARSFTQSARRSPDLQYHVLRYPQLPGTIKRSSPARVGTEQLFRSKKLLVPMLWLQARALPVLALVYIFTGRFDPHRELENSPTPLATEIGRQIEQARSANDGTLVKALEAARECERAQVLGNAAEWRSYERAFAGLLWQARRRGVTSEREPLDRVFRRLDEMGTPVLDEQGTLWLLVRGEGGVSRLGLAASNLLASDSDPRLAYQLMLARVERALKSPSHSRPTMTAFREDWALLERAQARFEFRQP